MKTIIAALVLTLLSGCAEPSFVRQDFVKKLKYESIPEKIVQEQPEIVYCFGGDKELILKEIERAVNESADSLDLPYAITGRAEVERYMDEFGDKTSMIFFRNNVDRFSVAGLQKQQVKKCDNLLAENIATIAELQK